MGSLALPIMSMALTVIGTATKISGQKEAGAAQQHELLYQSAVADQNRKIAEYNALMTGRIGELTAESSMMKTRAQVGDIVAGQAAGGIDVNTGSAAAVQAAARELGLYDALTIRSDAARKAFGYKTQAFNYNTQSDLLKYQAEQAKKATKIDVTSSLIGGASALVGQAQKMYESSSMPTFGSITSPTNAAAESLTMEEPFQP